MSPLDQHLLPLEPQYRERVWGGQTLRAADPPIGEAWIAFGPSRVAGGRLAGRTLDELVAGYGPALLGTAVEDRFGGRFPLLVKLIDPAAWLSVQVHPNDEQARRIVGPREFGKTEGWYFISAKAGAQVMVGIEPGVDGTELAAAMREGRILEVAHRLVVQDGDALLIPAGTLHALGPGLLLYEIQQASDTTFRIYDWDRPPSAGRRLHIEEAAEVTLPVGPAELKHPRVSGETAASLAIGCPYFNLDLIRVSPAGGPLAADTAGRKFHVVTVIEGTAEIRRDTEQIGLGIFESALVTGSAGAYEVTAVGGPARLLRAEVPDGDPNAARAPAAEVERGPG
ncbi:MAG: type I phosphomannose isomerase catalytic subunit [Candidatus Limnocylindrales bacterium]